jgi:stage III sporulation protein AG
MEKKKPKQGMLAKFTEKLKKNKKLEIAVYVGLGALALLIYLSSLNTPANNDVYQNQTAQVTMQSTQDSVKQIEERLEKTLMQIRGAGNVTVMITYETSKEIVPALSVTSQSSSQTGDSSSNSSQNDSKSPATITQGGNEAPIVLTEIEPKVRGVIVIAQGAADLTVRMNLMHAVQTVLGVEAANIEVFEMGVSNIND